MSKGYCMCFVKGVPKSTQIEWFVKRYSVSRWKQIDLWHVNDRKTFIDSNEEYIGVYMRDGDEYKYLFEYSVLARNKNFTEVFFPADDIAIGEL